VTENEIDTKINLHEVDLEKKMIEIKMSYEESLRKEFKGKVS
jgi:hypothetical protein